MFGSRPRPSTVAGGAGSRGGPRLIATHLPIITITIFTTTTTATSATTTTRPGHATLPPSLRPSRRQHHHLHYHHHHHHPVASHEFFKAPLYSPTSSIRPSLNDSLLHPLPMSVITTRLLVSNNGDMASPQAREARHLPICLSRHRLLPCPLMHIQLQSQTFSQSKAFPHLLLSLPAFLWRAQGPWRVSTPFLAVARQHLQALAIATVAPDQTQGAERRSLLFRPHTCSGP